MEVYSNDNPRFRKALIRERLEALKVERTALLAERERLDQMIAANRDARKTAPHRGTNGAGVAD